jgi:hypothetical protein
MQRRQRLLGERCLQPGSCVASVVGFEGLSCLLHRLTVPDLCPDGIPTPVRRFILKRLAKAKDSPIAEESEGNAQFLAKARTLLDSIATKADAAAVEIRAEAHLHGLRGDDPDPSPGIDGVARRAAVIARGDGST